MTILDARTVRGTDAAIGLVERHAAHNYSPLPVVAASAEGAWITDVDGRRYLDFLAAYSAVNFGHCNPEITRTAHAQLDTVTLVSRAFHSDALGPFCAALAELCGKDMVLPMNSGAEAVESGLKVARTLEVHALTVESRAVLRGKRASPERDRKQKNDEGWARSVGAVRHSAGQIES